MKTFHRIKRKIGLCVLYKNNYKCKHCNSVKDLCVHHIIKMKPSNPLYNDDSNMIVLCRSCHMSLHRKAGDIVPPKVKRGNGKRVIYCEITDCNTPQHAKLLCKKHYQQKLRGKLNI